MSIINNFIKIIIFILFFTQLVYSNEKNTFYDEFTYTNKIETGEVKIFKVQCHNWKKNVCNLNSLSIITKTDKQQKCMIISTAILNKSNASRKSDGSWQVNRHAGNCDDNEIYIFSKTGMELTKISKKTYTKKQIEKYDCKFKPSQVVKANFVDNFGVDGINVESCKEMDTLMLMGDFN